MKGMYTLEQMAVELERQAASKVDYLADTRRTLFTTGEGGSEVDLMNPGGETIAEGLVVNDIAHRQIGEYLGVPARFYGRLRTDLPALLDHNVNSLLAHAAEPRMFRALDGRLRAFLSDRYVRRDNFDVAQAVLPVLGDFGGDLRVESAALTDTRMYIKAVTPTVAGEVKEGDEVCAGVVIRNSEVGYGAMAVEQLVYRLVCSNGMIAGNVLRKVHVGRRSDADDLGRVLSDEAVRADDHAFLLAVRDAVRAALDETRFRGIVAQMREATGGPRVADPIAAVQVLAKREDLGDTESRSILRHLAEGGDLSRWGMLNAVTRASQDVGDYDRATDLEAIGGKILGYSPRDWEPVATAAA